MHRHYCIACLIALCATFAYGRLRPAFDATAVATTATHVIVAVQDQANAARLTISQSWRGDLREGDVITIPELAQMQDAPWQGKPLVLFLTKSIEAGNDGEPPQTRWLPATEPTLGKPAERLNIAMAWIDGGQVSAMIQMYNPGPLKPTVAFRSIDALKAIVDERSVEGEDLNTAMRIADPTVRVDALLPWTAHRDYRTAKRAIAALAECGEVAVPQLRAMFNNGDRHQQHLAANALAIAGGSHLFIERCQGIAQARPVGVDEWQAVQQGARYAGPIELRTGPETTVIIVNAHGQRLTLDRLGRLEVPLGHWDIERMKDPAYGRVRLIRRCPIVTVEKE